MFSQEYCVHGGQAWLLTDSGIPAVEAESRGRLALFIFVCLGKEVLAATVDGKGCVEEAVGVGPQSDGIADVVTVHLGGVNEGSVLIELLTGTSNEKKKGRLERIRGSSLLLFIIIISEVEIDYLISVVPEATW